MNLTLGRLGLEKIGGLGLPGPGGEGSSLISIGEGVDRQLNGYGMYYYAHIPNGTEKISYNPSTFPAGSTVEATVLPATPVDSQIRGVAGFRKGSYGNDVNIPAIAKTPVQVRDLATWVEDYAFTILSGTGLNLLNETFLSTKPGYDAPADRSREIGIMPYIPDLTRTYFLNPANPLHLTLGTYVDGSGRNWTCVLAGASYVIFFPTAQGDVYNVSNAFDFKALAKWLIARDVISGNEWMIGLAFISEPIFGSSKWRMDNLVMDWTAGATETNLVAFPNDLSNAWWAKGSNVTAPSADTLLEVANTSSHRVSRNGIVRTTGIKQYTAWAEVEGIGRDIAGLEVWAVNFDASYAALQPFNFTTKTVGTPIVAGGWIIENAFVTDLPGTTYKRIGFDFTTDATSTNFTLALRPMVTNTASDNGHAGDIAKGLKIRNIRLFEITQPLAPVLKVLPVITGTTQVGMNLTCSTGTWAAFPPAITYAYQWQRLVASDWTNIGTNSNTYTLVTDDIGANKIRCLVTPSNATGAGSAATTAVVPSVVALPGTAWDSANKATEITLSEADLRATNPTATANRSIKGTSRSAGKLYFEVQCLAGFGNIGVANAGHVNTTWVGSSTSTGVATFDDKVYSNNGDLGVSGAGALGQTGVCGVAVDHTARKIWFSKNGVFGSGQDPAAGTGGFTVPTGALLPAFTPGTNNGSGRLRTVAGQFTGTIPTGFSEWG